MSNRERRRVRRDLPHQTFYAAQELKRNGVEPDLVDLHALLDDTLTYTENRREHILPIIESKSPTLQVRDMEKQFRRYQDAI